MARLTYSVSEAAEALGVAKSSAYEAVHRGDIPSIRVGGRILIPKVAIAELLGMKWTAPSPDEAETWETP